MTRIVFLDRSTMAPHIPLTKPSFQHEWIEHDRTRPDQVVRRTYVATAPTRGLAVCCANFRPVSNAPPKLPCFDFVLLSRVRNYVAYNEVSFTVAASGWDKLRII